MKSTDFGHDVEVKRSTENGHAYYSGLRVCGDVWACPVCSERIAINRRSEIQVAVDFAKSHNWSVCLVTATLQHSRDDKLVDVERTKEIIKTKKGKEIEITKEIKKSEKGILDRLINTWRQLKQGNWWYRFKRDYKILGHITSLETTFGLAAGWHPHKHSIFFSEIPPGEFPISDFRDELSNRFVQIVEKFGGYASNFYGLSVEFGDNEIGDYVSKWGVCSELTISGDKKGLNGHYTPFELLDLGEAGEEWAGEEWADEKFREYARAFRGKRQLCWSRGLRQLVGLTEVEKTEEELAVTDQAESESDPVIITLSLPQWHRLQSLKSEAALLDIADQGDKLDCWGYLISLGIRPDPEQLGYLQEAYNSS